MALETAKTLFHQLFCHFRISEDIVSKVFRIWHAFFQLLRVTISLIFGYHPQSNGQTEWKIQEIGREQPSYCHDHQDSWSHFLPWAEYAQNSYVQATTGLTPFQCILGYHLPLFPWSGEPSDVPAVHYWFQESERVWYSAHVHLQKAVRRQKSQADTRRTATPQYNPGQKVWLSTRDIHQQLPCHKLSSRYVVPSPSRGRSTMSPTG